MYLGKAYRPVKMSRRGGGRWSCFFVTPFRVKNKRQGKASKARNSFSKASTTRKRPSFQSYHRPTLAHHSRFSLQSVASVESCCRTLLRSGAFSKVLGCVIFCVPTDFARYASHPIHTCLRYLKDAFLFHYSTVPHCSTVPLTSG